MLAVFPNKVRQGGARKVKILRSTAVPRNLICMLSNNTIVSIHIHCSPIKRILARHESNLTMYTANLDYLIVVQMVCLQWVLTLACVASLWRLYKHTLPYLNTPWLSYGQVYSCKPSYFQTFLLYSVKWLNNSI